VVLCDRFIDSTLAYQSYARGLPWNQVKILNRIATQGISPDCVVFLDLPPAIGLKRASDPNRFEAEGLAFQKKVRVGFLKAKAERPQSWIAVKPKNRTPEALAQQVIRALLKRYPQRFPSNSTLRTSLRTRT
jgi:dTMP kinase